MGLKRWAEEQLNSKRRKKRRAEMKKQWKTHKNEAGRGVTKKKRRNGNERSNWREGVRRNGNKID